MKSGGELYAILILIGVRHCSLQAWTGVMCDKSVMPAQIYAAFTKAAPTLSI